MSETASSPGSAASGISGQPPQDAALSWRSAGSLSDEDLLALLDNLSVPHSTAEFDDDEAAVLANLFAVRPDQPDQPDQPEGPDQPGCRRGHDGGHEALFADEPAAAAQGSTAAAHGSTASPVWIGEHLPAGPGLAAVLAQDAPSDASDWDLPGMAAGYRRLAAWAQARELAAVAEIATRRAAANPNIGAGDDGRPLQLPPEAAAEVALELRMSQYGASDWTDLGCQLRWRLPATFAALASGTIDLARARIIVETTGLLSDEDATAVEQRVLPAAAERTTGQLRAAVRRAVLAVDPDGAEQRRKDTERQAKISLYSGEEGTATLTGSGLPGVQAAAAMARITAMARALKSAGAGGGLDLLRAHIFIGLLLDTLPYIPPPADGPPDNPPPGDQPPPDHGPAGDPPPWDDQLPTDQQSPSDYSPAADPPPWDDQLPTDQQRPSDYSPAGNPPPADDRLPADGGPVDAPLLPADAGLAGGPDDGSPGHGPGLSGRRGDLSSAEDQPGWWPDVPCPGDADAPPDTDDPPGPSLGSEPDDVDDDGWLLPSPHWPALPARLPAVGDQMPPHNDAARARAGLLDVLIPWSSLAGDSREPGFLGRIGPVSSMQAQQLLLLATRSPRTEWRVIVTDDDGRALAVERARPPWHTHASDNEANVTGVIGRVTITIRARALSSPTAAPTGGASACPLPLRRIATMVLRVAARAAARAHAEAERDSDAGGCAHSTASTAYRPPRRMREFIAARDKTCRFGPCGQPAWRTDIDHTLPWNKGGRTCPCNLGGCCRTHHLVKHLPGWQLEQPQPGVFRWITPAARSYFVEPDPYPV